MDLDEVLGQFDAVEANLQRLEGTWQKMKDLIPGGVAFQSEGSVDSAQYEELRFTFFKLLASLPPIDGWVLRASPWKLDAIASARLDDQAIGNTLAVEATEEAIFRPGAQITEYRQRLNRMRRNLVRERLWRQVREADGLIETLRSKVSDDTNAVVDPDWSTFVEVVAEVERLAGNAIARRGRWQELRRHIAWAQGVDVRDIAGADWPSVRRDIESGLFTQLEPAPVPQRDLAELVRTQPSGKVSTSLAWSAVDAEAFERLLYNIVSDADDYANPQWLIRTNAPDKGRDISVNHIVTNSLSTGQVERVIIQAKHWLKRSVAPSDVGDTLIMMKLWEPPPVNVLIIATSGRFTVDAVTWIEDHNGRGERPRIDMWPESHLESLLAVRPQLVAEFGLRP